MPGKQTVRSSNGALIRWQHKALTRPELAVAILWCYGPAPAGVAAPQKEREAPSPRPSPTRGEGSICHSEPGAKNLVFILYERRQTKDAGFPIEPGITGEGVILAHARIQGCNSDSPSPRPSPTRGEGSFCHSRRFLAGIQDRCFWYCSLSPPWERVLFVILVCVQSFVDKSCLSFCHSRHL